VLIGYIGDQAIQPSQMSKVFCVADVIKMLEKVTKETGDWQSFLLRNIPGRHISGNHRHMVKEMIRIDYPDNFNTEPYWNQTLTQLFIGLSPGQARYLADFNNRSGSTRIEDKQSSKLKVRMMLGSIWKIFVSQMLCSTAWQNMRRAFETLGQAEWDKASDETKDGLLAEYESEEARDMHLLNMIKDDEKEGLQRHKKQMSQKLKKQGLQASGSQSTTSSDSHLFKSLKMKWYEVSGFPLQADHAGLVWKCPDTNVSMLLNVVTNKRCVPA